MIGASQSKWGRLLKRRRARKGKGRIAAGMLGLVLCFAGSALVHIDTSFAAEASLVEWKASAGFDYSVGDFGLAKDTELIFLPLSLQATLDRFRVRVTLPLLHLDGPTGILPDGTVTGNPSELTTSRSFGLGQLTVGASYLLGSSASRLPYLEATVKATAPTETKVELGSGVWAGALQLDVFDRFGVITPFAGFGRRFYEGSALDDRFYSSVGATLRAMDGVSVGIVYDWLQATSGAVDDSHQVSPFASIRLGEAWSFSPYAVFGLSDGAADFGAGCSISYRYSSALTP